MYWSQLNRSVLLSTPPSPVRYQLRAREQTAQITPPVVSRYGVAAQQVGIAARV